MTPKEKAEELVNSFYKYANSTDFNHLTGDFYTNNLLWLNNAKQCALICVYEEIETLMLLNLLCTFDNPMKKHIEAKITELNEVKQEIEKL
jgi:hypothetical protein